MTCNSDLLEESGNLEPSTETDLETPPLSPKMDKGYHDSEPSEGVKIWGARSIRRSLVDEGFAYKAAKIWGAIGPPAPPAPTSLQD